MKKEEAILSLEELQIGFSSGRNTRILLPPLTGRADEGELLAIIGRNGIGKSTLLRTLAGIQNPVAGKILYSGVDIHDLTRSDLALKSGYISTEAVRVNNMTVYDLVSLGRYPYTNWLGRISPEDDTIITEAIEKTSTSEFRNRFITELSDGERQKVMISRILAQDTPVMLMDEPTAFLDVRSKFEIVHLLHQLAHNSGKTIIFTTHDLHMAVNHADKIWLILDSGIMEGAPEDLMLSGAFSHLFESSDVLFDSLKGTYNFKGEKRGSIFVEGEEPLKHWTKEAIRRAGFSVSIKKTETYIRISSEPVAKWELISADETAEFNSVYDLVRRLMK